MLIFKVDSIEDGTRQELLEVRKNGVHPTALSDLSKRKLIEKKKIFYFFVQKGNEFTLDIKKQETDISVEMLQKYLRPIIAKLMKFSETWKTASFKPYNFNAMGIPPRVGALHPLMKMREEFRNIFFEMGYTLPV
jgi:phenylalanyl-tRNA synthetase alpha chain